MNPDTTTNRLPPSLLRESAVSKDLRGLASRNSHVQEIPCFLGAGAYHHFIPSAVDHILRRSEFYTAYTPYQPEISQGTLQAIFEFQSWICRLTGLDVSNASLYDGATAVAEAALMAMRITKRSEVIIVEPVHPASVDVMKNYLAPHDALFNTLSAEKSLEAESTRNLPISKNTAMVWCQQPSFWGDVRSTAYLKALANAAHDHGALFVVSIDPLSLGILDKPSDYDADIVVGEGQPLGIPLSYGGPYLGFMAAKQNYLRQFPGRIVGETVDADGQRAFCLTMQTREQHIRREKATSNICSNQALCALAATTYLSLMGMDGLSEVATLCQRNTAALMAQLSKLDGLRIVNPGPVFKEFLVEMDNVAQLNAALLAAGILGGFELSPQRMLIAVTEMIDDTAINRFTAVTRQFLKNQNVSGVR